MKRLASLAEVNTHTLQLRVPDASPGESPALSLPLRQTYRLEARGQAILKRFIQPAKARSKAVSGGTASGGAAKTASIDLPRQKSAAVMRSWGAAAAGGRGRLPLCKPASVAPPFAFLARHSADASLRQTPRLLVTRLLTALWCELREYYEVYALLVPPPPATASMRRGSRHHEELERQLHRNIDPSSLVAAMAAAADAQHRARVAQIAATTNAAEQSRQRQWDRQVLDLLGGSCPVANDLAVAWLDGIMARLVALLTTGQAREVLVHAFVDAAGVRVGGDIQSEDVLVSGVVDYIGWAASVQEVRSPRAPLTAALGESFSTSTSLVPHLGPPRCPPLAPPLDPQPPLDSSGSSQPPIMLDLSDLLARAGALWVCSPPRLQLTDVKTRSVKSIPAQPSVVDAAKWQVSHYRHFLAALSGAAGPAAATPFGYTMLLANAERRGADVDKPLGLHTMLQLLSAHSDVVWRDFVRLAQGQPLGIPYFDGATPRITPYDARVLLDAEGRVPRDPDFEGGERRWAQLVAPLLRVWHTPLTLRYFAARLAQLYALLAPSLGAGVDTTVEYHHAASGTCFKTLAFECDDDDYVRHLQSLMAFWRGERPPAQPDDVAKCHYCDFRQSCRVPNPQLTFNLGDELRELY